MKTSPDYSKTIVIANDHAGFELKSHLKRAFPDLKFKDLGSHGTESVDYPDFAKALSEELKSHGRDGIGVLICGSGQGMAIKANRYPHIRAALCWNGEIARLAREHNDANVLCLGARTIDAPTAEIVLRQFLETPFAGGRHEARVRKLDC